jgi:Family of unknown function (DUF5683)
VLKSSYIFIILFVFGTNLLFSQKTNNELIVVKDSIKLNEINPLAPAKAGFYSAILPGLGQAYNKKYWKIPIVYGALGIAVYSYVNSEQKYNLFRDSYKRRLEGYKDDALQYLDTERLVTGQKFYQRNKDLSTFFIIGIYVLNIIDANVDAHLSQFNVNENLSFKPDILKNDINNQRNMAIAINYQF